MIIKPRIQREKAIVWIIGSSESILSGYYVSFGSETREYFYYLYYSEYKFYKQIERYFTSRPSVGILFREAGYKPYNLDSLNIADQFEITQ